MDLDYSRSLRDAFGAFLTGVTVVTAMDKDNQALGFTANSFTSVSLEPPLVLVCFAKHSENYQAIVSAKGFAVNILSESQQWIAQRFATAVDERFKDVNWQKGPNGAPVLANVSAWFDCSLWQIVDAGDHSILMGKVEAFANGDVNGLGYVRGAYFTLSLMEKALSVAGKGDVTITALVEQEGKVLFLSADNQLTLPSLTVSANQGISDLNKQLAKTGLNISPGFVYSVYEAKNNNHIVYHYMAQAGKPRVGKFCKLDDKLLSSIDDQAFKTMLKRFKAESETGNYGVYFGNQHRGSVHQLNN